MLCFGASFLLLSFVTYMLLFRLVLLSVPKHEYLFFVHLVLFAPPGCRLPTLCFKRRFLLLPGVISSFIGVITEQSTRDMFNALVTNQFYRLGA